MTPLRIGYLPILDHLTLGIALHQEELAARPTQFANWSAIASALEDGAIDGAFLLFPLALDLYRRHDNLRLLLLGHREGQVLTVGDEIERLSDLKNRKIRLPHELSTHRLLLHEALGSVGLRLGSDVEVVFGYDDIRTATDELAAGTVDGFMLAEPMGTEARRRGIGHSLALSGDVQPHHIDCVLVLNQQTIDSQAVTCQSLIEALVRAGGFINAYPRQAAEIGSQFLGWPAPLLREALMHDRGHILYWDLLPRLNDVATLQQLAVDQLHLWPETVALDDFVDPSFAQQAYRAWMIDVRQESKDKGQARTLPGSLTEAIVQLGHQLGHPVEAIGVERVRPGQPYPAGLPRERLEGPVEELIRRAFRKPLVVESTAKGLKAIALVPVSERANRVILKLSDQEIPRVQQALHFGVRQSEQPIDAGTITLEDLRNEDSPWKLVQIANTTFILFNPTALRFLPLLLQQSKEN